MQQGRTHDTAREDCCKQGREDLGKAIKSSGSQFDHGEFLRLAEAYRCVLLGKGSGANWVLSRGPIGKVNY